MDRHLKDYDYIINHHLGKSNFVFDALSQKSIGFFLSSIFSYGRQLMISLVVKFSLIKKIKECHKEDIYLQTLAKDLV